MSLCLLRVISVIIATKMPETNDFRISSLTKKVIINTIRKIPAAIMSL
jgi:hypothetical protein